MKMPSLPELPELLMEQWGVGVLRRKEGYTADQMRSFALQYAESVREACVRECELEKVAFLDRTDIHDEFLACAAAIRRKEE